MGPRVEEEPTVAQVVVGSELQEMQSWSGKLGKPHFLIKSREPTRCLRLRPTHSASLAQLLGKFSGIDRHVALEHVGGGVARNGA